MMMCAKKAGEERRQATPSKANHYWRPEPVALCEPWCFDCPRPLLKGADNRFQQSPSVNIHHPTRARS